jgi:hypothetical protein
VPNFSRACLLRCSHPALDRVSRDSLVRRYLSYRSSARKSSLDYPSSLLFCVSWSSHTVPP